MGRDGFESGCLLSHAVRSPMADMRMPLKTAWPGVVPADVEVGNLDEVAGKYPAVARPTRNCCIGAARRSNWGRPTLGSELHSVSCSRPYRAR